MKILNVVFAVILALSGCVHRKEVAGLESSKLTQKHVPVFIDRDNSGLVEIDLMVEEASEDLQFERVDLIIGKDGNPEILSSITLRHEVLSASGEVESSIVIGGIDKVKHKSRLDTNTGLEAGHNRIVFDLKADSSALLGKSFSIESVRLLFKGGGHLVLNPERAFRFRPALVLRATGQDDCDTYRIPGLVTTNSGTLIAVYDNRYNNSKDLQEDIDVGMSRSVDGGQTWEPMQVIMDMGEWGGRSQRLNGIGDPSVLYDHTTNTIWVAALWISGSSPDNMLWWDSKPGMLPEETGQFVLVKSTDDGRTWSEPINITEQIKDPEWQLLLAGPGRGITLDDGTLVFPAQFKKDIGTKAVDGGQYTCHSTIVYSQDGGDSWHIGTGARPNTTEAQVVQLADGGLMLNMRDDLNRHDKGDTNGRAVSVTYDMGQTWEPHPSTNSALIEPNCMASLIAHDIEMENQMQQVLFFSNPNSKTQRTNMTIKTSLDGGLSWPDNHQVELFQPSGFGYSCMTMVDDEYVGIVYEGIKELYFQKVPVWELLGRPAL
ncbi:sialidase family protein [Geofilum rubicundum]|uniref:exo-alpha-sialidase n=1 Tax=Geofilum rubicundum JCM 15548 TaxID=1236989 RepID=A0A0E9LUP6_9BACT|nr:sialidase family protein [Geofilum rubicundum]GAO29013.1 sialidase [Geofilum rubicundum JCM 15548]